MFLSPSKSPPAAFTVTGAVAEGDCVLVVVAVGLHGVIVPLPRVIMFRFSLAALSAAWLVHHVTGAVAESDCVVGEEVAVG